MKTNKILYICLLSSLLSILAPIMIPISNIGITLAIFMISLICLVLKKYSVICIVIYITLGLIGLPVFQGYSFGLQSILGPTGGFIIGYIFYSLIVGILLEKFNKNFIYILVVNLIGLVVCYIFGMAWFMYTTNVSFLYALTVIIIPYVLLDLIKIILSYLVYIQLKKVIPNI